MPTKSEEKLRVAREVLEWLDKRGGLGYDAHDRIKTALEYKGDRAKLDEELQVVISVQTVTASDLKEMGERIDQLNANLLTLTEQLHRFLVNGR